MTTEAEERDAITYDRIWQSGYAAGRAALAREPAGAGLLNALYAASTLNAPLAASPAEPGLDARETKRVAVDIPTFTYSPDRCSVHGLIGPTVSVSAHIQSVHGMTYEQYRMFKGYAALSEPAEGAKS